MADNMFGLDLSGISGAVGTAGNTMFYLILFSVFAGMILYFMWFTSFNKEIVIKKVMNGVTRRIRYKCKIMTKKNGQSFLQLRSANPMNKETHPAPPFGVIEIGERGKEFLTANMNSTGELIYTKDTSMIPEIPNEILNIQDFDERSKKMKDWREKNKVIESYRPITTNQRTFYLNQIKQANNKTKLTIMDRITQLAPMMMLVVMLAVILIFGGKIYEPAVKLSENVVQHDKMVLQMQEKTDNIDKNVQKLVSDKETQPPPQ